MVRKTFGVIFALTTHACYKINIPKKDKIHWRNEGYQFTWHFLNSTRKRSKVIKTKRMSTRQIQNKTARDKNKLCNSTHNSTNQKALATNEPQFTSESAMPSLVEKARGVEDDISSKILKHL